MAWLAVDKDGTEGIYAYEPYGKNKCWNCSWLNEEFIELPKGSIKKLISRDLTWEDEPVELK